MGKNVCVIGAGAAGLSCTRQMLNYGHTPTCYESLPEVGGVFNHGEGKGAVYDGCTLTISNYLMSFSEFPPPEGERFHWSHDEYLQYLNKYAVKFGLSKHITFETEVTSVVRAKDGKYEVIATNRSNGKTTKGRFDAIAVCTGTHRVANIPKIRGLDTFTGEVHHCGKYKNATPYEGKRVLCIGLGESGADIVKEVSDVAAETTLSVREYPTLIPRVLRGESSDARTSRVHYLSLLASGWTSFAFALAAAGVYTATYYLTNYYKGYGHCAIPAHRKLDAMRQPVDDNQNDLGVIGAASFEALEREWKKAEGDNPSTYRNKFATKNITFLPNLLAKKLDLNKGGVCHIEGSTVFFKNGDKVEADSIILCTGYRDSFAFLKDMSIGDVKNLYYHSIHPDRNNTFALIGWCRPSTGGIPACAEMQSRYFASLLSGKSKTPKNLLKAVLDQGDAQVKQYHKSAWLNTIVDYPRFQSELAAMIGCEVNYWRLLFHPVLLTKVMLGSMTPHQFRLFGPHADFAAAKKAILEVSIAFTPYEIYKHLTWNYGALWMNTVDRVVPNFVVSALIKMRVISHYSTIYMKHTPNMDKQGRVLEKIWIDRD